MLSPEIIVIFVLAGLAWLWLDSLKTRDAAIIAAKAACAAENLMLLDDTVAIAGLRPARDAQGHAKLQRSYDFEFSDTGNNRRKGNIVMLGNQVVIINVGLSLVTLH